MKTLITDRQIRARIRGLAQEISRDYESTPITIVGVLTGSLIFVADLIRQLEMPLRIGFLLASSYRGTATEPGRLEILPELMPDVRDRHVLLLDDILDSGQTLSALVDHVQRGGAKTLKTGVLLRKLGRQIIPIEPNYCGFDIPDKFVVGYGLDYNDEHRNLPFIADFSAEIDPADRADPRL